MKAVSEQTLSFDTENISNLHGIQAIEGRCAIMDGPSYASCQIPA